MYLLLSFFFRQGGLFYFSGDDVLLFLLAVGSPCSRPLTLLVEGARRGIFFSPFFQVGKGLSSLAGAPLLFFFSSDTEARYSLVLLSPEASPFSFYLKSSSDREIGILSFPSFFRDKRIPVGAGFPIEWREPLPFFPVSSAFRPFVLPA